LSIDAKHDTSKRNHSEHIKLSRANLVSASGDAITRLDVLQWLLLKKRCVMFLKFYLVVSDHRTVNGGTSYIYGPFKTATERLEFQVHNFPKRCGRIVHPINERAFIDVSTS
jgi:hypothetical protein